MFLTRFRRSVVLVALVAALATGCSDDDGDGGATEQESASEFSAFCQDFQVQDPQSDYKAYKRAITDLWKSKGPEAVPPSVRAGYTTYVDIVRVAFTESGYQALQTDLSKDDEVELKAFEDFVADEC